ncbi:MAG: hypothetical protein ACKO23_18590, partial [Gemmataceae bacterium]
LERERNQILQVRDMLDRMSQLSIGIRSAQEVSSQETVVYSGFLSPGESASNHSPDPIPVDSSLRE